MGVPPVKSRARCACYLKLSPIPQSAQRHRDRESCLIRFMRRRYRLANAPAAMQLTRCETKRRGWNS